MKTFKKILIFCTFLLFFISNAFAEVKMPKIFSSNMVLQQGIEIPVWGWADKSEKVKTEFRGKTYETRAGKDGKWMLKLPPQEYGGPHTLTITGENTIKFENVMIGEVWICSGQSNMEWPVELCNNPEKEIPAAVYPDIRFFTVPKEMSKIPEDDLKGGQWEECTPETVKNFSGVGYFFGRDLHNKLDVPIGLIHSSWGGSVAETWMSAETIKDDEDLKYALEELKDMTPAMYAEMQRQKYIKELASRFDGKLPAKDEGLANGKAVWAGVDFDDSGWKEINIPSYWESQGYGGIDGIGWLRKEITLTEDQAANDITLYLGKVDDADITYFNGFEIGRTDHKDSWKTYRKYTIKKDLLRKGKNIITVRVTDRSRGGGIWGEPGDQYLQVGSSKIDLSGKWKLKISEVFINENLFGWHPNAYPTLLYNAMLYPLMPYAIKGAIWYQGESNAGRAKQYRRVFANLIKDWRIHWQQGDFPFLFVSLANWMEPVDTPRESEWAECREAQTMALELPNTGMAVTIDIGDTRDIHPKNKQDVGKRLVLNAFKIAYGQDIIYSGPMYKSVGFQDGKGIVRFSHVGSGLKAKDLYGYVNCFSMAGKDRKFHWAKAEIISKDEIMVYSQDVKDPVAVRFAWANNPLDFNLYNSEDLPANPFRTDNWPGLTK
jgi:sialate O-acetylesterase